MLSENVKIVYVFDYWAALYSSYSGAEKLFENVLLADSARTTTVSMKKVEDQWLATIKIPKDAALLSYYFTDGKKFDYNDNKTYVSYIYNETGKPVKNARFRNIDFLEMASASGEEIIAEAEAEVADYPKNWIAQIVCKRKIFEKAENFTALISQMEKAEADYAALVKRFGETDSLKQVKAGWHFEYFRNIYAMAGKIARTHVNKFREIMSSVPVENQFGSMKENYAGMLEADRRQTENADFMENLKGNEAPDFEFETIAGKKGRLKDFRDNYVLLEFWSMGCGPCISEIKNLQKAYDDFNSKGFEILSVCADNVSRENFEKFLSEKGITWHQVLENDERSVCTLYKVNHYPTFILIDPDGKVINLDLEIRGERLEKKLTELYNG